MKNTFITSLLLIATLATACSIPLDESPRELSSNLPDALLPPASTTTQPPAPKETVKIFLAKANNNGEMKLEPVNREISGDGSINVILDQVLAGPTLAEQETQLVSPFAEGSEVIGAILEDALLEIHLDSLDGFPQDDSKSNRLAFAMLVCTASELISGAEISFVRIMVRQNDSLEAINAPVTDGDPPEEGAAVLCSNYASFMEEDYFS
ncbi:MAG: GerMN domain-containing protein [Actinomycetota bacterium]|nr:GerMN domain-containing protein [Actinomycetota bacterium]|tara:strand:+ start:5515 stop:6141 length:627 start_codon:yes stop_codon:yes gene_type:complete